MKIYTRCSLCHYQEQSESNSINAFNCPKCNSNTFDAMVGQIPDWWKDEPEVLPTEPKRSKRMVVSLSDPIVIGWASYLSVTESYWWAILIPLVLVGTFGHPRWGKAKGWRFWHD